MTNLINELRKAFQGIETIDPSSAAYKKIIALLDRCDDQAIMEIYQAKVKFVSMLAMNRCLRRGLI